MERKNESNEPDIKNDTYYYFHDIIKVHILILIMLY